MIGLTRFITALYAILLRLYPPRFRAEFGDEMRAVFAASVQDAAQSGFWRPIGLLVYELVTLPANIGAAERLERTQNPSGYRGYRLRFLARYNSLWWGGLILYTAGYRLLHSGDMGPLRALQMALALSLLLAWRWERTGGLLAVLGGLVLCGLGLLGGYLSSQGETLLIRLVTMAIGCLWGAPFLFFGGLFVRAGMKASRAKAH